MRVFPLYRHIGVISLLSLLVFPTGNAAFADSLEKLKKDAAQIQSIQASFIQSKHMKILAKPLLSEGVFYYQAPDSFRWEYLKPLKSIVLNHKGRTKRYIYSGGKMVEDKSGGVQTMKIVLDEITAWMKGRFDSNPSFQATFQEGTDIQITLTPVDKSMSGMIEKIVISLAKKEAAVKTVKIIESASDYTQIDFKNVITNRDIPETVFVEVQ
ncbi:MAG TPA: outer membrane lipoprotein carrier protein LolA [Deltaproteobacteria bacterium]|nr:outer membrane lipoprotein carrier protein LolA [Deltaproteobacteria bacterium]